MALQKQLVPVKLSSGIDTKTDQKQLIPGKLLSLQNGVFSNGEGNSGQAINKRPGYLSLPQTGIGGTPISAGITIDAVGSGLIETDGLSVNSLNQSGSNWKNNQTAGFFTPLDVNQTSIATPQYPAVVPDSAYLNGYECFIWSVAVNSSSGVSGFYYSIIDRASGTFIANSQPLTAQPIKVAAFPDINAFLIFTCTSGGNISFISIPTSTPNTPSSPSTIFSSREPFADVTYTSNGRIYIGTISSANIYLNYLDTSLVSHSVFSTSVTNPTSIAVTSDFNRNVWIACGDGNLYVNVFDDTGASIGGPFSSSASYAITAITNTVVANTCYIYFNAGGDLYWATFRAGGPAPFPALLVNGVQITTKAFSFHNFALDMYFTYVIASVPQNGAAPGMSFLYSASYFGLNGGTPPAAFLGYENVGSFNSYFDIAGGTKAPLANINQISAYVYEYAFITNDGEVGILNYSNGVSSEEINFSPSNTQRAIIGNNLYLCGPQLQTWDGNQSVEYGFYQYPIIAGISPSISGGFLAPGSYSISATYDWYDAQGLHYRSTPAVAQIATVSGSGSGKFFFTVSTLQQTAKQSQILSPTGSAQPVLITIWISQVNGTTHFLYTQVANDPTSNTISFTVENEPSGSTQQLYTDGGEVDNTTPPAPTLICSYRDRLMLVPAENRTSFWYSKEASPGFPAEFSDLFVQNVTPDGGFITAIIQMDAYFIFFKAASPYYITGYGPAANGTNNDFTPEQIITSPVGTTNPASVVLTPDGIMFQASNGGGIWLLDRSLGVTYYGAEVEAYNSYNVTSAVLIPNTTQVRFTLSNGTALVWDYLFKQWSVFTNVSAVAATVYQGVYTYLTADGVVNQETPGTYTDNGSFIQLSLTTGWLPFAGVQGFQRVYKMAVLGEYFSPHNLNVQIAYDYAGSTAQTDTIVASATLPYEYRILIGQQKCTAIQVQIQDQQSSSYGQGLSLSHLAFEVGVKGGIRRIGQSQTYG